MSQIFVDAENQLFNVVIVSEYPCGGTMSRHSEKVNGEPVGWQRGCQWVQGIMTGIGRDWTTSRYVDIYMELHDCPRPMTRELQSMLTADELRRGAEVDPQVALEYREIITRQDVAYKRPSADHDRMAADVARPGRIEFWQGVIGLL
jgi:hypothetical protein